MKTKPSLFTVLSILLACSMLILTIDTAFAQDSADDEKKAENEKKIDEKKAENEKKIDEKKAENEKKIDEKRNDVEKKREELESDREKLQKNLSERTEKYEEKLREIKEKYQKEIDVLSKKNSQSLKSDEMKGGLEEKSEKIQERLKAKSEKLDSRTQKILEKIDDGDYMGEKLGSSKTTNTYELVFSSVSASAISDKSETSVMSGKMTFTTYDSDKSNLKLELESCSISVDNVPYVCGYGKARTASSENSGTNDTLVIIAFLEDDLAKELHSTLKIFLAADIPITQIEQSEVSILGPQSKLSHLWFIDGTATLTKIISDTTDDVNKSSGDSDMSAELDEDLNIDGN